MATSGCLSSYVSDSCVSGAAEVKIVLITEFILVSILTSTIFNEVEAVNSETGVSLIFLLEVC